MRKLLFFVLLIGLNSAKAQVYNFGYNEITFRDLINNGITYVKTGDPFLDSVMIDCLESYWTLTDYSVVEQYKRPDKSSTAFFITTKEWTNKHMMDRKNQHVLVLQPAQIYVPRKDVKMEETLGYMYLNGFYDLVSEEDEYRFLYMIVKSLNRGLNLIKEKKLTGEPDELNTKVSDLISEGAPLAGQTLIINREQTRHIIDKETLDKFGITYRLLAEDEYYKTIEAKNPTHVILYFAINRFTEMALVHISDGETLYLKHMRTEYKSIAKKELKEIAVFFK